MGRGKKKKKVEGEKDERERRRERILERSGIGRGVRFSFGSFYESDRVDY